MSKSIFIIDTPACCGECPMSGTGVCRKWSMKEARTFPKDCPLVKMPEKDDCKNYLDDDAEAYCNGYNACIEEICGGIE